MLELGLGLAGETGDESAADDQLGAKLTPARDALEVALATGRALHAAQHLGVRVLQRHVEVGQDAPGGHQRQQRVDLRVRVDVVQPHPGAVRLGQRAELLAELDEARAQRPAVPEAGAVLQVDAVGAGVLADDEQLLDAGVEQPARLAEHVADRARDEVAAHRGDDAEGAAVVAALADLEVGVVRRRQLDALRRHEVDVGVVRARQVRVHGVDHLLGRVRAGDGQHLRVRLPHEAGAALAAARAEAAGDDDAAVGGQRLADRGQALLHRGVDEAAGVDDDEVGAGVGRAGRVALGGQPGEDQLGVGQRLRAAEADETDGRCRAGAAGGCDHPRIVSAGPSGVGARDRKTTTPRPPCRCALTIRHHRTLPPPLPRSGRCASPGCWRWPSRWASAALRSRRCCR